MQQQQQQQQQAQQQQTPMNGNPLLYRLFYISQYRNRYRPADNNIAWFKAFVAEFFAESCITRIITKDAAPPLALSGAAPPAQAPAQASSMEVPFESLPRLLQLKYESGMLEEHLLVKNATETSTPDGGILITCQPAHEHLVFNGSILVQQGKLVVLFNAAGKIQAQEFAVTKRELLLEHSAVQQEMGHLRALLEDKRQLLQQHLAQGAQGGPGGAGPGGVGGGCDGQQLQEMMHMVLSSLAHVQGKLDQCHSDMLLYSQRSTQLMHMSDVMARMDELFSACSALNLTPSTALRTCGQRHSHLDLLNRVAAAAGARGEAGEGMAASMGMLLQQQQQRQQLQQQGRMADTSQMLSQVSMPGGVLQSLAGHQIGRGGTG